MKEIYRKYESSDIERVKDLMLQLGYPLEKHELEKNIAAIREKGGEVIVAETKNNVTGCVAVLIDVRLAEGVYAEIVSLVVSEEVRGKGIGKRLVRKAEEWAGKRANKIRVRANEIREAAHIFYENLGYNEVKTQKIFKKMM